MSFSHNSTTKTKDEALAKIEAAELPEAVRQFIRAAIGVLKDDGRSVFVSVIGYIDEESASALRIEVRPTTALV